MKQYLKATNLDKRSRYMLNESSEKKVEISTIGNIFYLPIGPAQLLGIAGYILSLIFVLLLTSINILEETPNILDLLFSLITLLLFIFIGFYLFINPLIRTLIFSNRKNTITLSKKNIKITSPSGKVLVSSQISSSGTRIKRMLHLKKIYKLILNDSLLNYYENISSNEKKTIIIYCLDEAAVSKIHNLLE